MKGLLINRFLLSVVMLLSILGYVDGQVVTLKQVVIPTQGAHYRVGNTALSWTLGETASDKLKNGNLILRQGFQQPIIPYLVVAANIIHKSDKHKGAIYLTPTGGIAPYYFRWQDVTSIDFSTILDSIKASANELGMDTSVAGVFSNLSFTNPDRRVGIDTGIYSVVVTDSRGYSQVKSYRIGNVSRFLITSNTLNNVGGTIAKTGTTGWGNNVCVSMIPVLATNTARFEFQVSDTGDFDFGFRDLSIDMLGDSAFDATNYGYDANEFYLLSVRSGKLNYSAFGESDELNIASIFSGDKISLTLKNGQLDVNVNGVKIITRSRNSASGRKVFTVARIYNERSAFKIIENIVY